MTDHYRYAILTTPTPIGTVTRYLPDNYRAELLPNGGVMVAGQDVAGWTLDGYVLPRLASGLRAAREVTEREAIDARLSGLMVAPHLSAADIARRLGGDWS